MFTTYSLPTSIAVLHKKVINYISNHEFKWANKKSTCKKLFSLHAYYILKQLMNESNHRIINITSRHRWLLTMLTVVKLTFKRKNNIMISFVWWEVSITHVLLWRITLAIPLHRLFVLPYSLYLYYIRGQ